MTHEDLGHCDKCEQIETYLYYSLLLLSVLPLFLFVFKAYRHQHQTSRHIIYSSMAAIISLILAYIAQTIYLTFFQGKSYQTLNKTQSNLMLITDVFTRFAWALGEAMTHVLFLQRLYTAFKETKYQSPLYVFQMCYLSIVTFLVIQIAVVVIRVLWYLYIWNDVASYKLCLFVLEFSLVVVDMLLSVYLVYLFIKKLFAINYELSEYHPLRFVQRQTSMGFRLNEQQQSLIHVISKYFVLSTIAITSSCVIQSIQALAQILHFAEIQRLQYFTLLVYWYLFSFDVVLNIWCIYLGLEHAQSHYNWCCRRLHTYCNLWCTAITRKKLQQIELDTYVEMQ